eukprot:s2655_g13.t1
MVVVAVELETVPKVIPPVPVSVPQSMRSVTERPLPSKGTIIAQPGPGHPPLCCRCPEPVQLQFLRGIAVPTSNQQLLFSRMYHAAIARPSAFNASAFASRLVVLDVRPCSSQRLQLAKGHEEPMPESHARREMLPDEA